MLFRFGDYQVDVAAQSWTRALRMLRVVLDLEPDYEEARRELSRVEALAARLEDSSACDRATGHSASLTI
jgi:hypothetical protein